MPRPHLLAVSLVVLILPVLGGCKSWTTARPDVILTNLEVLESTMFEQRLRAHLRILNPNDFDLEVGGLDVTVDVNGTRLARGVSGEGIRVPRLGDTVTTLDVSTTVFDLVRQAVNLGEQSALDYRVHGGIHLVGMWGGTVPFDNSGSLGSWDFSGVGKRELGPLP